MPAPNALALLQAAATDGGWNPWAAVLVLAAVQGLTEFLPVSSSGHLVLGRELVGLREVGGALMVVALHVGTLAAVVAVYRRDLVDIAARATKGDLREPALLLLGSVPAAAVGLGFKSQLEGLFESPDTAAAGLLVTAVLLLVSDRARRRRVRDEVEPAAPPRPLGVVDALAIGAAQALAIVPGISRSGSTIAAGLLRGLEAHQAARFSFLLSIPAIGGAALLEARHLGEAEAGLPLLLVVGLVVSALVGLASLRLLLVTLERGAFPFFALYCAAVGLAWLLLA